MSPTSVLFERTALEYSLLLVRYAGGRQISPHTHDGDGYSVVLDGEAVEEAQHRSAIATAGWTASRPAGLLHANRFGPRGAVVLGIVPHIRAIDGVPRRWQWTGSASLFRAALRLLRHIDGGGAEREDALNDFIALLADEPVKSSDLRWLQGIKKTLDDPASTESVASLALKVGVHPVYLTRKFRAAFGTSIREYRQIANVRRAIQLVVATGRPLSTVAQACGFADHSHMCRSFRLVVGWPPSALRV